MSGRLQLIATTHSPEVSAGVGWGMAARDGEILFDRGYELASREWNIANDGDTVFRLGLVSKQFTAVP